MENKQIVIKDYFNILRDGYGRIYCIQEIGDPKSLIKAIREQNDYIQAKEQECEDLKEDRERWKSNFNGKVSAIEELLQQIDQFKAENERLDKELSKVYEDIKLSPLCYKCEEEECLQKEINQLKADNEQLEEELSVIQHNCNREGCKYYDDDTFKVFYECKAQKALQLGANSITTKYCDLLKAIIEIKAICNNNDELQGDFNVVDCDKYKLGKHNLANKILQKIKEYKVEE